MDLAYGGRQDTDDTDDDHYNAVSSAAEGSDADAADADAAGYAPDPCTTDDDTDYDEEQRIAVGADGPAEQARSTLPGAHAPMQPGGSSGRAAPREDGASVCDGDGPHAPT